MTREATVGGVRIEVLEGDITDQPDVVAVVNAANAELTPGGGVAGAIHDAAGPGLAEECRPLAPIRPGECVITSGHDLPNPHVLHCLGPVYGEDEPAEDLLAACYRRALELAEEHGLESVCFPSISTGAFGYPLEEAAPIALRTVGDATGSLGRVRLVRFALFGREALEAHARALEQVAGGG